MTRLLLVLAVAWIASGCATHHPTHPDAFSFGVLGDTPYTDKEEVAFEAMIHRINAEPLAFSIHVGDIKGGSKCSDELFAHRKAQFDSFAAPLVYTPGDNEWTDCRRDYMGSMDPLERLVRLRQVFFTDRFSLGVRRIATQAQDQCMAAPMDGCGCAAYPENRTWEYRGIRFVTLNVPGSDNNVGFDAASDQEARCRNEANARWLSQAADAAAAPWVRALVIAIQADPWRSKKPVYAGLIAELEATARRVGKPVLFIHGDSHTYTVDFPFAAPITRLETFGSPFVGWVKVNVDPGDPRLFSFEPQVQALVR